MRLSRREFFDDFVGECLGGARRQLGKYINVLEGAPPTVWRRLGPVGAYVPGRDYPGESVRVESRPGGLRAVRNSDGTCVALRLEPEGFLSVNESEARDPRALLSHVSGEYILEEE